MKYKVLLVALVSTLLTTFACAQDGNNRVYIDNFESSRGTQWGWSMLSAGAQSVMIANRQLIITNNSSLPGKLTRTSAMLPIDPSTENFRLQFQFTVEKATMFSSLGVELGGNCSLTINSGNSSVNIDGTLHTSVDGKLGLGSSIPVVVTFVKTDNVLSIQVNGGVVYSGPYRCYSPQIMVSTGSKTTAMLHNVRLNVLD